MEPEISGALVAHSPLSREQKLGASMSTAKVFQVLAIFWLSYLLIS